MSIRLLEPAQQELDEAIVWYNLQAPGLGDAFLVEVLKAFRQIERFPQAWHPITEDSRRFRLHRFPYGVIYSLEGEDIIVLAIAHLHRKPDYWQDRLRRQ